jgi:hypothetical protein
MAAGELKRTNRRQGRWGGSVVLEMQDDALCLDGVGPGDYVVVNQSALVPEDDALVVIEEKVAGPVPVAKNGYKLPPKPVSRFVLRKLERIGNKIRLLPGSSPGQRPYLHPDETEVWGTVVAVMRKFEAA